MIVTLKPHAKIIGFAADCWQLRVDGPDGHARTAAEAATFPAVFASAIKGGHCEPGKVLDLAGFNALVRDAACRFAADGIIRLGEGYLAHRVSTPDDAADAGVRWRLLRDTGRGQKHAVQCGEAESVAAILAAAAWRHVFCKKETMGVEAVGAYLTGIAHRILDGATAASAA